MCYYHTVPPVSVQPLQTTQTTANHRKLPPPVSPAELKQSLVAKALSLGFADCRVAAALPAAHRDLYAQWIAEGKHGDMAWMARNIERRSDPRMVLPGAQSVIVLALNYFQGGSPFPGVSSGSETRDSEEGNDISDTQSSTCSTNNFSPLTSHVGGDGPPPTAHCPPPTDATGPSRYRIARYAWNNDYHDLINAKLAELNAFLTAHGGTQRPYVDTGPVLERDFASEAGLGWGGKSTMQIHRRLGTWFFLADILTTLELPPDAPGRDMCGNCTRCMVACPTQAITTAAPRRLDARRCISYLTIESKGPIPLEFRRAIGDHLYGCDACLDACPWNRHAQASHEATFQARETVFNTPLRDFLSLTDESFRALFAKSPIKRIKRPAFLRNVCVVLGNTGSTNDLPALEHASHDEHPLIAEHAAWAIEEIRAREG